MIATTGGLTGLSSDLSSSVENIVDTAMKAGESLMALGQAIDPGKATGPNRNSNAPDESATNGQSPFSALLQNFVAGLKSQLESVPKTLSALLETTGKDALSAVLEPLKEIGKSLLDKIKDGIFGKGSDEEQAGEVVNDQEQKENENGGDREEEGEKSLNEKISEGLNGVMGNFGESIEGVFGDLTKNFKGLFEGLTSDLGGLLGGLFGGGGGGGLGGLLGSLFGDGGGGFGGILGGITSLFGFAGGGRIQPGVPAIVGERGPELIVPTRPGTVMNNADSRGGAGKSVAVSQTVNFDLVPGPTISAMIDAKKAEIERAAIEGTLKALNRGMI